RLSRTKCGRSRRRSPPIRSTPATRPSARTTRPGPASARLPASSSADKHSIMGEVRRSLPISALAAACVFAVGASTGSADRSAGAIARAWAIKVIVPGQASIGTRELDAPDDAVAFDGAFAYPTDGSIVSASSVTTSVTATSGTQASAGATSQVTSLQLFKGDLVAASVTGETHTSAGSASASGDVGVTGFTGLVILGQPVTPAANQQI